MSLKSNFQLMAQYNRWMNEKLYEAAFRLGEDKMREDQGAFFKSVFGTLNHILVGDMIWLKRFARHAKRYQALIRLKETPNPTSLDAILYDDFMQLQQARQQLDEVILQWSQEIDEDDLAGDLEYTNTKGDRYVDNFGCLVQHFYNHQTHHRGQITTLLSQNGIDVGSTDLLMLIRK